MPQVLTVASLGATQSVTPEGFLFCQDVRIARTGPMLYLPDEIPDITPGANGAMITVLRDADVLFHPDTIASFAGKSVTNDHPDELVSPMTWGAVTVGVMLSPRRGTGIDSEYLVADLMITDADAIADVQAGKREVSCGYDTDAETVRPGLGRVTKIVGNHVALVDRGRCGPSCAIQDGVPDMAKAKRSVWDRLTTAFHAKDEAAFSEELEAAKGEMKDEEPEPEEKKVEDAESDPYEARFAKIEDSLTKIGDALSELAKPVKDADPEPEEKKVEDEAAEGNPDEEDGALMDSATLRDDFRDTIARAEILSPGIKLPVFDAKSKPKLTVDAMCGLRRRALKAAHDNSALRPHVAAVLGNKPADFTAMTCDTADMIFRAASELVKASNAKPNPTMDHLPVGGPMTPARYAEMVKSRNYPKK